MTEPSLPADDSLSVPAIRRVCVYCGSSSGNSPRYTETATALGQLLSAAGIELVYGGGRTGLMGAVADAALATGGRVTGVIPVGLLEREVAHRGLTELVRVGSMHERKAVMFNLADAFVILPGGLGTLEELTETATWSQLGMHAKPMVVVDPDGYWSGLWQLLDRSVREGFMKEANRQILVAVSDVNEVVPALSGYRRPQVSKWLNRDQT